MKWSLVLSGGGAKGLAYIGMLKAFEELKFPKPDFIAGCSMGAIIGGLYASGMEVEEMEAFFSTDFEVGDYIEVFNTKLGHTRFSKIFQIGAGLNNLYKEKGIDSGEQTHTLLKKLFCYQKFENLKIPFACNATELCEGNEVLIDTGFLADAVRASSSYPICFAPFEFNEKVYVDGCVKNNTPVWIAKERGYKNILAVTLGNFQEQDENDLDSVFAIVLRSMETAASQNPIAEKNIPSHLLNIDTENASYDFSNPQAVIEKGYRVVMDNKKNLELFFKPGFSGKIARYRLRKEAKEKINNERIF